VAFLITEVMMAGHMDVVSAQTATVVDPQAATPETHRPWTFDAVYETHFAFVWRTVRRLGGADNAVEDIVQDVFLIVHRRLGSFEGQASIRSWLFAIATRVVRDSRRSLRRKPGNLGGSARSSHDVDAIADARARCPDESAAKAEAVQRLHEILAAMSDQRREIFILAELEQMPVVDIAAAVNANVNTVHSRLRAARAEFERAVSRASATGEWRIQ
jgi:RNA polymerase sigma-70 factor (ECF subfamily)